MSCRHLFFLAAPFRLQRELVTVHLLLFIHIALHFLTDISKPFVNAKKMPDVNLSHDPSFDGNECERWKIPLIATIASLSIDVVTFVVCWLALLKDLKGGAECDKIKFMLEGAVVASIVSFATTWIRYGGSCVSDIMTLPAPWGGF